jgi:ERF superfamily
VRKILGQHGIATIQTTAIDQTAGTVNLTTMLAHASGEWVASDWPVCAIGETATPHRMGAALTYARRYALFTLVGIAGEDDLDAPDLLTPTQNGPDIATPPDPGRGRLNGVQHKGDQKGAIAKGGKAGSSSAAAPLGAEASAALCDGLVAELNALQGGEDAALWAFRSLPDKSRLSAADAKLLEEAFQARLPGFAAHSEDDVATAEWTAKSPFAPGSGSRRGVAIARDRQDRFGIVRAAPGSRPQPRPLRRQASLPDLRSPALRYSSSALSPNPGAWPQSQRRVHCSLVSWPPSRGPPLWR